MQVYNEKRAIKAKRNKNAQFEEKKEQPGNLMLEPMLVLKEVRKLRKILNHTGIKGRVFSGQDSTQISFWM